MWKGEVSIKSGETVECKVLPLYYMSSHPWYVYSLLHQPPISHIIHIAGAPFQWAAIFHKGDINFTHGHHDLGWYDSGEKTCKHKLPCKVSCAYCRTPIMDEGRNMILLFPTLIHFKSEQDRKNFEPRYVK